jgi:hypothetical protein
VAKKPGPLKDAVSAKRVTTVRAVVEPPPKPRENAPPTEEAIRLGAYYRWDAAGRPGGDGTRFWLEAERELTERSASK